MPPTNPGIDNLVSHWSLEEATGNASRVDDKGGNDLTATGSPGGVAGKVGTALDLIDTSDLVQIVDGSQTGLDPAADFSVCFWFNPDRDNAVEGIFAKWNASPNFSWYMQRGNDEKLLWFLSQNGSNFSNVKDSNSRAKGSWVFGYCYHDDGTEIGVSTNASTIATTVHTTGVFDSNAPFRLGGRSDGPEDFLGLLDQVAFFNRLLTTDEIDWMYNSGNGRSYSEIAPVSAGARRSATFF